MKNIVIVVPETSIVESVADPQYMFNVVNQFLQQAGLEPLFNVFLAGMSKEVKLNGGSFSVHIEKLLEEVSHADLIFVPAISGDISFAVQQNDRIIKWLITQFNKGAEIATLCIGAFLLAETRLLDGRPCSTHWSAANDFRRRYPKVNLVDGHVVTDENGIYTSGGANSYWSLLLHLVEKYTNRSIAILASKYFAVDIDRKSQAAFAMFQGQKAHNDEAVKVIQTYIEQNIDDRKSVDDLATMVHIGRRSFERRFKIATNNSVLEYMQKVKIESAKRSLENSNCNINEVMYQVGYTDTKAFRTIFKKMTGLTPNEYRNKYNKTAMANS